MKMSHGKERTKWITNCKVMTKVTMWHMSHRLICASHAPSACRAHPSLVPPSDLLVQISIVAFRTMYMVYSLCMWLDVQKTDQQALCLLSLFNSGVFLATTFLQVLFTIVHDGACFPEGRAAKYCKWNWFKRWPSLHECPDLCCSLSMVYRASLASNQTQLTTAGMFILSWAACGMVHYELIYLQLC